MGFGCRIKKITPDTQDPALSGSSRWSHPDLHLLLSFPYSLHIAVSQIIIGMKFALIVAKYLRERLQRTESQDYSIRLFKNVSAQMISKKFQSLSNAINGK